MQLKKSQTFGARKGPVVFVVMDGVGVGKEDEGNAVHLARTPYLDALKQSGSYLTVQAHGTAVGLPSDDDMGNSEVGHNALGAGRIFSQGAKLVNQALASRSLFEGKVWCEAVDFCTKRQGALHFIGLLSDGNVHAHMDHLEQMIAEADRRGVSKVFIHALLDGRDVGETSALEYIDRIEAFLRPLNDKADRTYKVASGGGRMKMTMDRYEADWPMVELGWNTHVHGQGRRFATIREAVETIRDEIPGIIDQNFPAFVIGDAEGPTGPIRDGDSVILYNFRGDRAIEISKAFDDDNFTHFDRGQRPEVYYAGMMEYDGDYHIPAKYLVDPPSIDNTMGELLAGAGVMQFACSETQKFGHVTYFWNGNKSGFFDDKVEVYQEIPSENISFDIKPWMKAGEITDATIAAIESGKYQFIRINFANGDMVGHTGNRDAAVVAVEVVDLCVGRLKAAVEQAGGVLLVTADHGNADEMYMWDKKKGTYKLNKAGKFESKTSHTLNPVPVYLFDAEGKVTLQTIEGAGLSNLTSTTLELLGFEVPEDYNQSLLGLK